MSVSKGTQFESPDIALKQLSGDFNEWCSILTTHSIQAAFAIIGANWAVHRSTKALLSNRWAVWSMIVVLGFLGINLLGTYAMTVMHHRQFNHAEENPGRWRREYEDSQGRNVPWPYTRGIERLGEALRILKVLAPVIAAILLVISLLGA